MRSTLSLKPVLALLLVGLMANVNGVEKKQFASKGRKEAPPFIDAPLSSSSSTVHHPAAVAPPPPPPPPVRNISPTGGAFTTRPKNPPGGETPKHSPEANQTPERPEEEEEDGDQQQQQQQQPKVPFFLIFHIPRIIPPDRDLDYGWGPWGDWSPCPAECGGVAEARSFRVRRCELAPFDAGDCDGENLQWKPCEPIPCPGGGSRGQGQGQGQQAGGGGGGRDSPRLSPDVEPVTGRGGGGSGNGSVLVGLSGLKTDAAMEAKLNADGWSIEMANEYTVNSASAVEGQDGGEQSGLWRPCASPCPFEIHLRRRRCYLGQLCTGDRKEIRVCTRLFGQLACGRANLTNTVDSDPGEGPAGSDRSDGDPWTDRRFGWSSWTAWSAWTACTDDCCYDVQVLNSSVACLGSGGGGGDCAEARKNDLRICRKGTGSSGSSGSGSSESGGSSTSVVCGSVEKLTSWKLAEEIKPKKNPLDDYHNRVFHAIVVLVLLAPLLILCFYWLATKSRRPRYEPLPSVHTDPQSTISADASSAVGPNHLLVKDTPDAWKTI